jgi:hypothetical protein
MMMALTTMILFRMAEVENDATTRRRDRNMGEVP